MLRPILRSFSIIVAALCLSACVPKAPTTAKKPNPLPADPWVVATNDAMDTTPALLWNGIVGYRFGRDGSGAGPTGEPLPYLNIGSYQPDGEEKILWTCSPHWVTLTIGDERLYPSSGSDYKQELLLKDGRLQTSWAQKTKAGTVKVWVEAAVDPTKPFLRQTWTIGCDKDTEVTFTSAVSPQPGFGPAVSTWKNGDEFCTLTNHVGDKFAVRLDCPEGVIKTADGKTTMTAKIGPGRELKVVRGVESADPLHGESPFNPNTYLWDPDRWKEKGGVAAGFWDTDIEIDGPVEDQQAIRSWLFYLRTAIPNAKGPVRVSPLGLSGTTYNGHVFWDADLWVFPALSLLDPDRAKSIPAYRVATLSGAEANFKAWKASGYPVADGKKHQPDAKLSSLSKATPFKFAWESSVTGRETVPGPSRFEDHITGTVAWSANRAAALGLLDDRDADKIISGAAAFWLNRISLRPDGKAEIKATMSPDENHTGDNDLFTNIVADWCIRKALGEKRWPAGSMYLPKDNQSFLTYDGDAVRGYKQAAAVLAIYPLQYFDAIAQSGKMMARFEDKVNENGPAMSDSVHATIEARHGDPNTAYNLWLKSWKVYSDYSLLLFSEKKKKEVTYFTTGAAGSLQTVLYGFAGLSVDTYEAPNSAWTVKLKRGYWLSCKPHMPKQWKSMTIRGLQVLGSRYDLRIVDGEVTATKR